MTETQMRFDLQVISSWIEPKSRVLDLGCGQGDLLYYLQSQKNVQGVGIESDEEKAAECISRGLSVLQENFNEEVLDYPANHFDYVVLSQTLQQVYKPEELIHTLLTIGTRVIVSFPNFSHWWVRLQLLFTGLAPKNDQLPYEWYNSPNIRVITMKDFRKFISTINAKIVKEVAINSHHHEEKGNIVSFLPDWRATYGIFLITAGPRKDTDF
ncbi:MAG: methionine biosynthesis protein MetW [Thermodesulfobacteriota bacterium]